MREYVDFHYMPLEGKITGEQVLKQTEDAINDFGNKVYSLDIDQSEIDEAIEKSNEAINTANSALVAVTTGRSVWFNNVAEMVATDIEAGVTAETKGYYVANDGGNALYLIRQEKSGDVVDGGSLIALDNGNMAELVTNGTVNVKQFGAIGNGTDDDTTAFQNASAYAQSNEFVPFVGVATYKITGNVAGSFNSFGEATIVGGGSVDIINLHEVVSDVSDIRDEVVDETANARTYAENAQTSATNASNSASSASTTATQLMAYLEDKETLTAPAVDPTLTISGAAADAKTTGDAIKSTKAEMSLFGIDDLLWDNTNPATKTSGGVTYTVDKINKTVTVSTGEGSSTGDVNLKFWSYSADGFPSWLNVGKQYYIHLYTDADVSFQLGIKVGDDWTYRYLKGLAAFTIPSDANGVYFGLFVASGKTVNTVVRPFISESLTLGELGENYEFSMNYKPIPNNTDLNDIKDTRCGFLSVGTNISYGNNPLNNVAGVFRSYKIGSVTYQIVNEWRGKKEYSRSYWETNDTWSSWIVNNDSLTKEEASLFGVDELLWDNTSPASKTSNGVTYTVDAVDRSVTVSSGGNPSTGASLLIFYYNQTEGPSWLQVGKTYIMHMDTDADVTFEIWWKADADTPSVLYKSTKNHTEFTVPNTGWISIIRVFVENGKTINTVVRPFISEALSLKELTDEVQKAKKSIKVLVLGHSTFQDNSTYVPWIMQNIAPEVDLTMGISYKGTHNLEQLLIDFNNDVQENIVSIYHDGDSKWTNYYGSDYLPGSTNGKTIKEALTMEDWDVITIGCGTFNENLSGFAVVGDVIDAIVGYVSTDHGDYKGHAVKMGLFMQQVLVRDETAESYPTFVNAIQNVMSNYPLEFVVPCGTAIQNAKGTTLDQYGDGGHLTADGVHLHEGIGCYCGSCTTTLKILELAGVFKHSVLGENTRPDLAWVTAKSIPGKNPGSNTTVVGISDANCLIAQKCAVMAIKKPFEVSTIY